MPIIVLLIQKFEKILEYLLLKALEQIILRRRFIQKIIMPTKPIIQRLAGWHPFFFSEATPFPRMFCGVYFKIRPDI